jgi:formamidopyrimidine-DNA glycosylase
MTGRFNLCPPETEISKHEQLIFILDNGLELRFHDTRKFGRVYPVADPDQILGMLGPEPLDPNFTFNLFKSRLKTRKRRIKPLLLDQTFIAGLGNIYVDEALWAAKLHPELIAAELSTEQTKRLYDGIRAVLAQGIANNGTTLGLGMPHFASLGKRRGDNREFLQVFRRTGRPCFRCGQAIQRIIVGQRSTHICPNCQRLR